MTSFSHFSDYQESDARSEVEDFVNNSNMASVKFSTITVVKEIKLVHTFEDDFESGDESI